MIILGTNSIKDTGYNVDNSLRFNIASDDHLSKTFSSAGNQQKFTFSAWVKLSTVFSPETEMSLFSASADSNNFNAITIGRDTGVLRYYEVTSGTTIQDLKTSASLRDPSAWYHILVAVDSTQGTSANRTKFYINGIAISDFSGTSRFGVNTTTNFNSAEAHKIGYYADTNSGEFGGYMSEVCFINNAQLAPTSFGEFDEDSGIWKPIDVSDLTFGTNGFYLEFKQAGTGTNASGMGADTSGNTNHFAVNNLTAVDQSIDTCTNNFATLNPLSSAVTLSEGNLQFSGTYNAKSTFAVSSGKWYLECKVTNNNTYNPMLGFAQVGSANIDNPAGDGYAGDTPNSYHFQRDGKIYANGSSTPTQTGLATIAQNDIVGLALDLDSGTKTVKWYKNGSSIATQNISETASEPYIFWTYASGSQAGEGQVNFGGTNTYSISSGNTDGNGFGNFEYAVPSGYFALNTKNLAEHG